MKTLIHPTAVIHPEAQLHPSVQVGPYAVIGEKVTIGAQTTIGAHAVIEGPTAIGSSNRIFPGAIIGVEPQDLKYQGADSWVRIGDRNTIREYVTIHRATNANEATLVGNGNLLMAYVHIAHNCAIEDQTIISNSVALAGHVTIESQATISGVLGIHQFVHIGKMSMIGGMSRINRDVPPFMLVEGNPARVRSLNLVGLKRRGLTTAETNLLKKAFRLLYRSGLSLNEALDQLNLLPDTPHLQHLRTFLQLATAQERRGLIPGSGKSLRDG
ncbi:MAG: acyl-ACP--UDP-N-acetylglucosamine O-acyltransferase [Cyanophyceae cyanobacterium]